VDAFIWRNCYGHGAIIIDLSAYKAISFGVEMHLFFVN
jgi:hypothetical protein